MGDLPGNLLAEQGRESVPAANQPGLDGVRRRPGLLCDVGDREIEQVVQG